MHHGTRQMLEDYQHTIIPEIRSLRKLGMGFHHIARTLNNNGHRTRLGQKFYAAGVERIFKRAEQVGV